MDRPRVLIIVEGGVVQNVITDSDVIIVLFDRDNLEGGDTTQPHIYPADLVTDEVFHETITDCMKESLEELEKCQTGR